MKEGSVIMRASRGRALHGWSAARRSRTAAISLLSVLLVYFAVATLRVGESYRKVSDISGTSGVRVGLPSTSTAVISNGLVLPLRPPMTKLTSRSTIVARGDPRQLGNESLGPNAPGRPHPQGQSRSSSACIILFGDSLMRYLTYALACHPNGTATTPNGTLESCGAEAVDDRSTFVQVQQSWGMAINFRAVTFRAIADLLEFGDLGQTKAVRRCVDSSGGPPVVMVGAGLWDYYFYSISASEVYRFGRRIVDEIRRIFPGATIFFYPKHPTTDKFGLGYYRLQRQTAALKGRQLGHRVAVMCAALAANDTAHSVTPPSDTQNSFVYVFDPLPYVSTKDLDVVGIHYTGRSLARLAGAFLGAALDNDLRSRLPSSSVYNGEYENTALRSIKSCSSHVASADRVGLFPTFIFMHRFASTASSCEWLYYGIFGRRFERWQINATVNNSAEALSVDAESVRVPRGQRLLRIRRPLASCAAHLAELMDEHRLNRTTVLRYLTSMKRKSARTAPRLGGIRRRDGNRSGRVAYLLGSRLAGYSGRKQGRFWITHRGELRASEGEETVRNEASAPHIPHIELGNVEASTAVGAGDDKTTIAREEPDAPVVRSPAGDIMGRLHRRRSNPTDLNRYLDELRRRSVRRRRRWGEAQNNGDLV